VFDVDCLAFQLASLEADSVVHLWVCTPCSANFVIKRHFCAGEFYCRRSSYVCFVEAAERNERKTCKHEQLRLLVIKVYLID